MCTGQFCCLLPSLTRLLIRQTFYYLDIEDHTQILEFCYASIKATERQTEKTEEFSEDLFDPEESKTVERKMDCKVIIYNKHNEHNEYNENDKHNDNECDKSNKN